MPSRADINPKDIVEYLPFISMIDVERNPMRFRFRLVGTETVRAMGMDVTGKYSDMNPAIATLNERYMWVVENKRPYLYNDELTWSKSSFLDYYALGLPLSNDDKEVNIILYGMYYTFPNAGDRTIEINVKPPEES